MYNRWGRPQCADLLAWARHFDGDLRADLSGRSQRLSVSEVFLIALAVPRLHDIGLSAWWAFGVFCVRNRARVAAFFTLRCRPR